MEEINLIPKYSEIRALEATDTDFRNRWKISSAIKHMLAVAGVHSNMSGWGWNTLKDGYNVCLVLVQTHIEMVKYPSCYTRVKVSTWPDNEKHAIITRYFSFEDADTGELYGKAAIQCVLMDMTARTVVWANKYDLPWVDTSHLDIACKVPKLRVPKDKIGAADNRLETHRAVYTDLDYNSHVNNAKYVEWVENLFSTEQYLKADISSFDIKYHKEIKFGEKAVMEIITDNENSERYFVRGTVNDGDEDHCCFEASIKFG
ncbi:MAG: hypothetical protein IJZ94_04840 [Clostridia bacterium]|nr:hypothetical protein [Clostridia bacterium]